MRVSVLDWRPCIRSDPNQEAAAAPTAAAPVAAAPVAAAAETPAAKAGVGKVPGDERASRLAVGEQAPGFRLQDQTGTDRTLKELLAGGKVALVFYRSADW